MKRLLPTIVILLFVLSIIPPSIISGLKHVAYAQTPVEIVITQDNIETSPYYKGGHGTPDDPWVLEFGTLDLEGGKIWLTNFTGGYILIKDSEVYNGGDYLLDIWKNVSNIHLAIMNCKLHGISGQGPVLYISATNSTIYIMDSVLYNASSTTWWDAVLTVRYSSNTIVHIDNSTLYWGGHIIRISNVDNVTLNVFNSNLYGVKDDAGWGTDWRGLIRVDGSTSDLSIYVVNSTVSGRDAAGPASFIEVEASVDNVYVMNTTVESGGAGLAYGVYVESGHISNLFMTDVYVEYGAITTHFIAIYSGEDMDSLTLLGVEAHGLGKDLVHIGSDAAGIHINSIMLSNIVFTDSRYLLGFSPQVNIDFISVSFVNCSRVSKVMSIPNDNNKIELFAVSYMNVYKAGDGFDIRGISNGYFSYINLTYFNPNDDEWIDGNGFYLVNVNNTIFENIFFWGAGWKEFILDNGHFENITIRNFISMEYPGTNGRNPFIGIGTWGTATVKNLIIENGTIYDEDLITQYDTGDYIEGLIITNVSVHGSAPAGWEGGRCGRQIYLLNAKDVVIRNVLLENAETNGIYLNKTENVEIVYTNISRAKDYGLYIESYASNVIVHNSTFWYNAVSPQAYSDSSDVVAMYNLYTDHTARDLNGDGIADEPYAWAGAGNIVDLYPIYSGTYLYFINITDDNAADLAVSGSGTAEDPYVIVLNVTNVPESYRYAVYINVTQYHIVVKGTVGGSQSEAAVYVSNESSGLVKIEDLEITSSGKHGLILDGASDVVIENLTIGAVGGWAIGLWGASNVVFDQVYIDMQGSGWDGVYIDSCDHVKLLNVKIYNPQYKGIYLKNSHYITLDNVKIDNTGDDAIQVYNVTHFTLENSFLGNAKWHDLKVVCGSYITIINTTFNGIVTGGDGVVFGDGGEVYNVYMENVVIKRAEWKGLWLYNTVNATLVHVVIDGEGAWFRHPGLGVEGRSKDDKNTHDIVIKDCIIKGVVSNGEGWESGIFIKYAKNVVVENCEVAFNTRYGIQVYVSEDVTIRNSNIYNNSGTNIILFGSVNVVIEDNNITGAKDGYGVGVYWSGAHQFYSRDVVIKNNYIAYNSRSGIKIQRGNIEGVAGGQKNILIAYNVIEHNGYGNTTLEHSYGLVIEENTENITVIWNDFIDNYHKPQAFINSSSVLLKYNYWSDYTGTDENLDGYGDQPYITDGVGIVDPYPRLFKLGEIYTATVTTTVTETTTETVTTTQTTTETVTTTETTTETETETVTQTTTDWTITGIIAIVLLIIGLLIGFFTGKRG